MLRDKQIAEAYYEATTQQLREQDKTLAFQFARAIEAAVLAKLREGGVELPEPDGVSEVVVGNGLLDGKYSFTDFEERPAISVPKVLDYGDRRAAAALAINTRDDDPSAIHDKSRPRCICCGGVVMHEQGGGVCMPCYLENEQ